jgi:hypothetical protein
VTKTSKSGKTSSATHSTTFGHEHWKDGWKPVPADIKKWLIEAAQMEVQDEAGEGEEGQ